ncbi:MAG: FliI/YscN family ATPase [Pseudomonadota bacterium]
MPASLIQRLSAELQATPVARQIGRIQGLNAGRVTVKGLEKVARPGDRVTLPGEAAGGEVISLDADSVTVLPEVSVDGLSLDGPVLLDGPPSIWPDDCWLGRVVDPNGEALDGRVITKGAVARPLAPEPMNPAERRGLGKRIATGLSVFDTVLPLVRGQRIGLFAGAGVGKSTLVGRLATGVEADVIVVALIGERGREVREFTEEILGPDGMRRAVVVAATADRSPLLRRRCADAALAVAEHFRDQGKHVLLLADSVTRYADAHREIALQSGETAAMRGHPPSMAARVMALAERAGPGDVATAGDVTAIFSVLVAGSDMEEPVADTLRGVLDGHVVLSRDIAERGRFPAVDVGRSVSRSLPGAATGAENEVINAVRASLGLYERNEMMVRSGLYTPGSDAALDEAIRMWPGLDAFFASRSDGVEESFARLGQVIAPLQE